MLSLGSMLTKNQRVLRDQKIGNHGSVQWTLSIRVHEIGFHWSDMHLPPFFFVILPSELIPQVSASYDIGKWWGQP